MILFRVVRTDPTTEADFLSHTALGIPIRDAGDPEAMRLAQGVSMLATEAQAQRRARTYPSLGRFIATLDIPEGSELQYERTGGGGHHTVWGEPAALLARVVAVRPVERLG